MRREEIDASRLVDLVLARTAGIVEAILRRFRSRSPSSSENQLSTAGSIPAHCSPMCRRIFAASSLCALLIGVFLLPPRSLIAQDRAAAVDTVRSEALDRDDRIALFLDCSRCDGAYIRREITFVDHVRDRERADVHVLVTDQRTGSGGREYTFHVIGRGPFTGEEYEVSYSAPPSATEDQRRSGYVRTLKIVLAPFLMRTPAADRMSLTVEPREDLDFDDGDDPWKGWTIEIYGDGSGNVESSQYSLDLRYGVFVDRITEDWKIRLRPYFNYNVDQFEQDDETIRSESRRDGFDSYVIRSISSHWSIGQFADVYSSTFANINLRLRAFPGVEYSVFPYPEASRRRLTFTYQAGVSHVQYRDTTIFGKISEVLPQHAIDANYDLTQPWGSIDFGLEASQYLHDRSKYRVELDAGVSVRLSRGLSLHFGGELELIHDQLNLPMGDASLEELLLRRRQLATSYELSASMGFRYRFGSIYNNVVNTRF